MEYKETPFGTVIIGLDEEINSLGMRIKMGWEMLPPTNGQDWKGEAMNIKIECCRCGREFNATLFQRESDELVALINPHECDCGPRTAQAKAVNLDPMTAARK